MSLRDWLEEGHLREHRTSLQEVINLFEVARRDLRDSGVRGLSRDRKLATAYNAALQLATIALAVAGYRAAADGQHYWTFQSLAYTLKSSAELVDTLDKFRTKRNISDYKRAGAVTAKEAREMVDLAKSLYESVVIWLRREYPQFLPGNV